MVGVGPGPGMIGGVWPAPGGVAAQAVRRAAKAAAPNHFFCLLIIVVILRLCLFLEPVPEIVDSGMCSVYCPRFREIKPNLRTRAMKVKSSLKSLRSRHRDCKVVRRRGRTFVINKTDPRFKAKQG